MVHKPVFRVGYQGDIGVALLPLLGAYLLTHSLTYSLTHLLTQACSSLYTVCYTSAAVVIVFIVSRS